MNSDATSDNSTQAGQIRLAERELASFIGAVRELFGPEQALLSAEDWLYESALMETARRSTSRDWRAITIAASVRLANRVTAAPGVFFAVRQRCLTSYRSKMSGRDAKNTQKFDKKWRIR